MNGTRFFSRRPGSRSSTRGRRSALRLERLDERALPSGTPLTPSPLLSPFLVTSFFDQATNNGRFGDGFGSDRSVTGINLPTDLGTAGLAVNLLPTGSTSGVQSSVRVYNSATHAVVADLNPFGLFNGGARVGVGDVNHDGTPDIVVAAGPGGGPHVVVYDGASLLAGTPKIIMSFFAYSTAFTGGVNVAVGDLDGDGFADIVTGADAGGGPHVEVFSGKTGGLIGSFFAYASNFTGGVNVAVGNVNGTATPLIVTGPGFGGGPDVRVFNATGTLTREFLAYGAAFTGGVNVAAADLTGSGQAELITGAGAGGGPHVEVFNPNNTLARSFFAFDPTFTGGVTVGAGSTDASGIAQLLAAPGAGVPGLLNGFNGFDGFGRKDTTTTFDNLGNFFVGNTVFVTGLQGVTFGPLSDLPFVVNASNYNLLEITLGNEAANLGSDPAVRAYGAQMVQAHTAAENQLQIVLQQLGSVATLPPALAAGLPGPTADVTQLATDLAGLAGDNFGDGFGNDFDETYIDITVLTHEQSIAQYQAESTGGQNANVRAYASAQLPLLIQQLQVAQQLQQQIGFGNG
jgi:predicted outer membrane protein